MCNFFCSACGEVVLENKDKISNFQNKMQNIFAVWTQIKKEMLPGKM